MRSANRTNTKAKLKSTALSAAAVLALSLGTLSTPAFSAPLELKRGISMELWNTWPAESEWSKQDIILPFPEWRKNVSAADLADLKKSGLDFVRLPIDPGVFLSKQTRDLRAKLMDEVDASVALIQSAGLNVIVDLHTIPAKGRTGDIEALIVSQSASTAKKALRLS
jgi:endoglucanase